MAAEWTLRPLLAVLVSLLAAIMIVVCGRKPNLRESWTLVAAVSKFAIVFSLLGDVTAGRYPEITLFELTPGITFALRVDPLGLSFALSASCFWMLTSV